MAESKRGGAREGAGRPARGRQSKCVTLTMSLEAAAKLKEMADRRGLSISNFIVEHFNLPRYSDAVPSPYQLQFPAQDMDSSALLMAAEESDCYKTGEDHAEDTI